MGWGAIDGDELELELELNEMETGAWVNSTM